MLPKEKRNLNSATCCLKIVYLSFQSKCMWVAFATVKNTNTPPYTKWRMSRHTHKNPKRNKQKENNNKLTNKTEKKNEQTETHSLKWDTRCTHGSCPGETGTLPACGSVSWRQRFCSPAPSPETGVSRTTSPGCTAVSPVPSRVSPACTCSAVHSCWCWRIV